MYVNWKVIKKRNFILNDKNPRSPSHPKKKQMTSTITAHIDQSPPCTKARTIHNHIANAQKE